MTYSLFVWLRNVSYQITIEGDNLTRLTTDSNVQQLIAWSPDGIGLYYLDYLNRIVYIANDDSHAEKIVIQERGRITGADLSSDGQWLVYILVFREGIHQQQATFEVRTDDGERRQILEDIVQPNDLVWSSDGEWLAFTAAVDDHQQIFRAHADGSQVEQLTFEPRNHTNPDWSPIIDKGWTWHSLPLILAALIGLTATSQLIPLKRK
jgi:TolB protein